MDRKLTYIELEQRVKELDKEVEKIRKTDEMLREGEETYRTILENIEEGYYETDIAGNFTFINEAMCKIRGYSRDELMGMNNRQYMTPEVSKSVYNAFNEVYTTGNPLKNLEWETIKPDGSKTQVEVSASLIKDLYNQPVGFRGIVRDVTERKLMEEEKKRLHAQLQQAQKLEAIGTLAGGIAHDFNNILGAILGYTELALLEVPQESTVRPKLIEVFKAGHRAKDLVKRILSFSRSNDQGRKPVQPSIIVKEALQLLRSSLPSTIQIKQYIRKEAGIINAEPTQIHQILMNLCTNAAHAMRDKGGILKVNLSNVDVDTETAERYPDLTPGLYVNITVNDTGHGMDPSVVERIFEPYFTTKAVGEGTGLGLSVVHGIVRSYGGAVKVDSEPGKGSTFQVFLPSTNYIETQVQVEEPPDPPKGSQRILLVDDEKALVYAGQGILEHLGYEVIVKTDGVKALEAFRAQPEKFDLVITDLTMPAKTGTELAKELLQIKPEIPIILCSGFSDEISEEMAKAVGIRKFIMKPIIMSEIAGTIRQIFNKA
jgi:PAS domain S-box-containing protein